MAWLAFSVIQILLYGTSLLLSQGKVKTVSHGFLLLAVNTIFAGVIYAWLNEQLSSDSMVIIAVATYLLAMLNGCWQVISTLINNHSVEEYVDNITGNMVFDPTTNLPSYQYALQVFSYTVKHQQHARYAAIVFKPVNFQQVNAVLGHHNSDILLLQLAYCLQKSIKSDEELLNFSSNELPVRLARLQGLHFLVVMDVAQSKHSDEIIIEQLCQKLAKAVPGPMSFKSFSSYFKLVFGVAFIGKNSYSVTEVIAMAEDALLAADKQQKQISFFAQDLAIFNQQQLQKMEQLKRDIAAGSLTWQVQPKIKLASKALLGFELLMTWQQQNEKLDFNKVMVIAEQSGDAYTLCQQMVKQAFIFLKEIHYLATKVSIAIKLSNSCLLQPDLVDYIEQQALDYNIECQYLLIEIQETSLLSNSQKVKTSIEQLKSLGVKIAIDEFSGSYEALRYLRRLAVSEIKINCHALAQAAAGSSDKAIINALINLTRKMELLLVGTNINSIEAEKAFLAMGGEYAQGKYYSSGVSLQALPNWLTSWSQPPLALS
jgi:EAL domain-containing protein (putative c-di-GMP-specific phosphodiesterase class I)/GGDEF domain-containing protein